MSAKRKDEGGRMWLRAVKGHRAARDLTVPCRRADPQGALREAMHTLDLGMPMWLPRQQADWVSFGLTRFLPEHFLEPVDFDRLEVSYIAPDEDKKPKPTTQD